MTAISSLADAGIVSTLLALVGEDGTAAAAHAAALASPAAPMRDLADAVHLLCVVHGAFPGVVDSALRAADDDRLRAWLADAAGQMAAERALLARLTAAVGPRPSTPGQAESEAALLALRQALDLLARSGRAGCAAGTALAFVLDWAAVRHVLDGCVRRTGVPAPAPYAPAAAQARAFLMAQPPQPAAARAMTFGAQQMLAQHRGLWQLLEARAEARAALERN